MEHDVIGHLIDVERSAFDMMMNAQNEVDARKKAAKEQADQQFRTAYEAIIDELETTLEEQKKKIDTAREDEYDELETQLAAIEQNRSAFTEYLDSLFSGI